MKKNIRRKISVDELMDERKRYNRLSHSNDISTRLNAIPISNHLGRGPCGTAIFRRIYESPVTERQVYTDLFVNIKDHKYFSLTEIREVQDARGVTDFGCTIKYYGWRAKSKYISKFDEWLAGCKN